MNEETRQTILMASRPVRIALSVALGMLALFLFIKTLDVMARFGDGENPMVNTITVTGTGTSTTTPDIARVTFTVQERASDVKSAQDAATERGNDAIAAMSGFGVDDADVKTLSYNVSPQYESASGPCYGGICAPNGSNRIIGYQVTQTVQVTVRDLDAVNDVLAKLGDLGVQNVSGPDFGVDDDEGVTNEARAEAIENAREKAEELAKELGVSLGDVVSYYDQSGPMPRVSYDSAAMSVSAAGAPAPMLPTGTDERTVTVSVTYEIR